MTIFAHSRASGNPVAETELGPRFRGNERHLSLFLLTPGEQAVRDHLLEDRPLDCLIGQRRMAPPPAVRLHGAGRGDEAIGDSGEIGIGGVMFRTVQLFVIKDVQTGLVWATKILTDPFHDIKLYHKAPLALLRGELIDPGIGREVAEWDEEEAEEAPHLT